MSGDERDLRLVKAAAIEAEATTVDDAAAAAEAAGLVYENDTVPGLTRRKAGRGFVYLDPAGHRVTDERTLARIKALAVPPAWTDVWISRRARGHLQATGWDARHRKQYRYHDDWRAVRDLAKFERTVEFGRTLTAVRERVKADLALHGLPPQKVVAALVALLDQTLIRVGNEEYARTNDSYGLTTLRTRHAVVAGTTVRFAFRAKGGFERTYAVTDRRLARIVRQCQELPGQELFQYVDSDGDPKAVGSRDVNAYLEAIGGGAFTAKDFRTWGASVAVLSSLATSEVPESTTARRRVVNAAIKAAALQLANTPAVCRRSYVHPSVVEAYPEAMLQVRDGDIARLARRHPGLHADELRLLAVLGRMERSTLAAAG